MQIQHRYIVTETPEGMVVIDQHALHERILFEQLKGRIRSGPLETQRLLGRLRGGLTDAPDAGHQGIAKREGPHDQRLVGFACSAQNGNAPFEIQRPLAIGIAPAGERGFRTAKMASHGLEHVNERRLRRLGWRRSQNQQVAAGEVAPEPCERGSLVNCQ